MAAKTLLCFENYAHQSVYSEKVEVTLSSTFKGPVYRISLVARMSIILSHSGVLLDQNHRNLNCVSMHIFEVQNPKYA